MPTPEPRLLHSGSRCTPPPVIGFKPFSPVPNRVRLVVLLLVSLGVAPVGHAQPPLTAADTIGRWQGGTRTCSSNLAAAAKAPCTALVVEQQDGLLTIRFISPGRGGGESDQLSFAGLLQPGSIPMACQQGRCRFQGPISTAIASVSERNFDSRGLAKSLPKAWPANGSCRFETSQLRCEATALSQERWSAEATF